MNSQRLSRLEDAIRNVPDFPKPGIQFKDITPVLQDPWLCQQLVEQMAENCKQTQPEAIAGIESRGFLFGMMLAQHLSLPFVPIRKSGKLPWKTHKYKYDLEYGSAEVEIHSDAFQPGTKVLIHDDLLATGGTANAAANLIKALEGEVCGFSFLVELSGLNGRLLLEKDSTFVNSLISYR